MNQICERTKYSFDDTFCILNTLGDVIKDNISHHDKCVEMRIFPGLKLTSKFIKSEESKSNLNLQSNSILSLSANFTDDFRKKVRKSHQSYNN